MFNPTSTLSFYSKGARSRTAEQMATVLKFDQVKPKHLHSSFADLKKSLVGGDNFALHVANKLYGAKKYKFLEEFLNDTR